MDGYEIVSCKIHPESIEIEFTGGWVYEYTYASAGVGNVECMKALAAKGQGLSEFVKRNMPGGFASKTRSYCPPAGNETGIRN